MNKKGNIYEYKELLLIKKIKMKKGIETMIKQIGKSTLEPRTKKILELKWLYMDFAPELKKEIRENKDKYPDSLFTFLLVFENYLALYSTNKLVEKTSIEEKGKAKDDENEMLKKQNNELKEQNEELWKLLKDAMNTILGLYNTFWWTKFEQLK